MIVMIGDDNFDDNYDDLDDVDDDDNDSISLICKEFKKTIKLMLSKIEGDF